MKSIAQICTVLSCVLVLSSASYYEPTGTKDCEIDNVTYKPGDNFGSKCSPCWCTGEDKPFDLVCMAIDCAWPVSCVDHAFQDDDDCCGYCPNGPNCQGPNGIIGVGESYINTEGANCTCLERTSYNMDLDFLCIQMDVELH